MIQEKVVRITAVYRDPGVLERIMGTLRRLWVDLEWMNAKVSGDTVEITMKLKESKNQKLAILNLSKTVDIERVEVLENDTSQESETLMGRLPIYKRVTAYEWGDEVG
ncbi:hypothetical protein HS1genome_2390 [Sulfodiicoccus acidiphilus]|uniref:Acetolactate synthase small subunit n=1 Tax=Sulfodiicoccus acidiphilus TaxID=1670455 RepID=A0A348B749_9CREN|nr:ACT domain-containing protein [Sulfodiicoccus acidiphilus]BBD74001.1 hypothetical protein HS1genome_2390 [Sulfodiicoccus acidiphilus]GGT87249.1 hypothetical protein GCM10007116_01640 [Sulfodiicoccus acidiphilus]